MKGAYETKVLIVNKNQRGMKKGTKRTVQVDAQGTPLDKNVRRALKDANIDGCVAFENTAKKAKAKIEVIKEGN